MLMTLAADVVTRVTTSAPLSNPGDVLGVAVFISFITFPWLGVVAGGVTAYFVYQQRDSADVRARLIRVIGVLGLLASAFLVWQTTRL
jgi:hypothetical protein